MLDEAIDRVIAGPQRRTRLMNDHEKKITAYHEGGHALVAAALPHTDPVHKVTILPRGRALGYTMVLPDKDKYSTTRAEMLDQLAYMLGGRAAEELVFHDPTTGATNDIEKATAVARAMVTQYGMTERLGAIRYGQEQGEVFLGRDMGHKRDYSEEVAAAIDEEVRAFIDAAHHEAYEILVENRDVLDALVLELLEKETLDKERDRADLRAAAPSSRAPGVDRLVATYAVRARTRVDAAQRSPRPTGRRTAPRQRPPRRPRRPESSRRRRRRPDRPSPARERRQPGARAGRRRRRRSTRRGPRPPCASCSSRSARTPSATACSTPRRGWPGRTREMFAGLRQTPEDVLTTTFDLGHDEMVLVKDIELYSTCEHHLVPFHGVAHVGYIPGEDGRITGLSKLARLVDVYAKRPQVQERLTTQVADALVRILEPRGVIVVIECEHLCMSMRGVRKPGAKTVTSAVRGQLRDPATRAEAMSLIVG